MGTRITPFLWFDDQAEAAAKFYVSIFRNSKITELSRYPEAGYEIHGRRAGTVMTVAFELDGQPFIALNGGPHFTFNEAVSFVVNCKTQAEVDHYWDKLLVGGAPQQCGWLKDQYGVSWQIVPTRLSELMADKDAAKAERVMQAMLRMVKLDIEKLEQAAMSPAS